MARSKENSKDLHKTVIVADKQTAGRGRRGNQWISVEGNLYCSILWHKAVALKDSGQASFVLAVALADTFLSLGVRPEMVTQKWPNDVLLDGQKCAGILLESQSNLDGSVLDWLVMGIGVNVAGAPETATYLNHFLKTPISRDAFLDAFLMHIEKRFTDWYDNGFENIRHDWLKNARGLGDEITVRLSKETLYGIFEGISPNGNLLLKQKTEVLKIASGDVFF